MVLFLTLDMLIICSTEFALLLLTHVSILPNLLSESVLIFGDDVQNISNFSDATNVKKTFILAWHGVQECATCIQLNIDSGLSNTPQLCLNSHDSLTKMLEQSPHVHSPS